MNLALPSSRAAPGLPQATGTFSCMHACQSCPGGDGMAAVPVVDLPRVWADARWGEDHGAWQEELEMLSWIVSSGFSSGSTVDEAGEAERYEGFGTRV